MAQIKPDRYAADFFNHIEENYRYNTARSYKYAVLDFHQYLESAGETLEITKNSLFETSDIIKQGYYQSTNLHSVKTNAIRRCLEYVGKQRSRDKTCSTNSPG